MPRLSMLKCFRRRCNVNQSGGVIWYEAYCLAQPFKVVKQKKRKKPLEKQFRHWSVTLMAPRLSSSREDVTNLRRRPTNCPFSAVHFVPLPAISSTVYAAFSALQALSAFLAGVRFTATFSLETILAKPPFVPASSVTTVMWIQVSIT